MKRHQMRRQSSKPNQKYSVKQLQTPRAVKGKFNEDELAHIRELFRDLASRSPNLTISESDFEYLLDLPQFFAERLFRVFDTKSTGEIDWDEFINGISKFTRGTREQRLEMLFEMWDLDESEQISRDELDLMIHQLVAPKISEDQDCKKTVDSIVEKTLFECDIDNSGTLSFDQFKIFIQRVPAFDDMVQNCLSRFIWTRDDNSPHDNANLGLNNKSFSSAIAADLQATLNNDFEEFDIAATQSEYCVCKDCNIEYWQNHAPPYMSERRQVIIKSGGAPLKLNFCPICGSKVELLQAEAGLDSLNILAWDAVRQHADVGRMEGPLWKKERYLKRFVKRHFSLRSKFLYQFKKETNSQPDRALFLQGYFLEEVKEGSWYGFRLVPPNESDLKPIVLYSKDFQDLQKWINGLRAACKTISIDDFYDIGDRLGDGAFSVVYKCTEISTGNVYAVKKMDKMKFDEEEKKGMQNEIAIMKIVRHPGLVQLKDLYETPNYIYMVMPLLKNGDLMTRLRERGAFKPEIARRITKKLLSAITYLHSLGICHRDLKPENVFMASEDDDSDIALGDFGLSKFVAPKQHMTDACGTVCYAAPELLEGKKYDKKVDAWSCGCLLYLMLIGGLPFYHNGETEDKEEQDRIILQKILNDEPSFDYVGWQNVPKGAIELIKRLLEKNPSRRLAVEDAMMHPWLATCNITPMPSPIIMPNSAHSSLDNMDEIDDMDKPEAVEHDEFSEVNIHGAGWVDSKQMPLRMASVENFRNLLTLNGFEVIPSKSGTLCECIGKWLDPSCKEAEEYCRSRLPSHLKKFNSHEDSATTLSRIAKHLSIEIIVYKLMKAVPKQVFSAGTGRGQPCKLLYYNQDNLCNESDQNAYCVLQSTPKCLSKSNSSSSTESPV